MKLIKIPTPPCDHQAKAMAFYREHGSTWPVGTQVQCDCGAGLVLRDDQRDGLYWHLKLTVLV